MTAVLLSDRRVEIDADVRRSTRALKARGLEIQLLECVGCETDTSRIDEALRIAELDCRTLTVVLEGRYASDDEDVGAGFAVVERRSRWRERWAGPRQRLLTVRWEKAMAPTGRERLGPAALEAWRSVADAIARATMETATDVAAAALDAARAAGVHLPTPREPLPEEVIRVQQGLNTLFTRLHEMPQAIDLEAETGRSARHLRRICASHPDLLPSSLRETLHRYRLIAADSLLRSTDRTGKEVAAALGYRSDRALYTALRRSGVRSRS